MKSLIILLVIFSTNLAMGMSYVPIPFEKQLEESYGVIEGKYISHEYKKNKKGAVVTVNTFSVDKFVGIKKNEVLSQRNFQVIVPGGIWQDEVYQIHGTPKFNKNESVVLLVRKGEQGFELNNLGLGKYVIHRVDGKKVVSSTIFPKHPKLSGIDYDDYTRLVNDYFGERFVGFSGGKKIFLQDKKILRQNSRMPASSEDRIVRKPASSPISIFWLILVFALLGGLSTFYIKKN